MTSFNFNEIFTVQNIIVYFIVINLIGFFVMWLDKRKAIKGSWRIPEKTLFLNIKCELSISIIRNIFRIFKIIIVLIKQKIKEAKNKSKDRVKKIDK